MEQMLRLCCVNVVGNIRANTAVYSELLSLVPRQSSIPSLGLRVRSCMSHTHAPFVFILSRSLTMHVVLAR